MTDPAETIAPGAERRHAPNDPRYTAIAKQAVAAFDEVNGCVHAGFRPTHAKGILLTGTFFPSGGALELTGAPHIQRPSTPVTARFSDFGGNPAVDDTAAAASPRGLAIRFHLAEHQHTDIVAHSIDGFPARTAEEFVEFLHAAAASKGSTAGPSPIEAFLEAHPAARAFVQTLQAMPASFACERYFGVNAFKFANESGAVRFGRYRIRPEDDTLCSDGPDGDSHTPNFLVEEIQKRLRETPVRLSIYVQIAAPEDVTDDATVHWPADRPEVKLGTVELTAVRPNNAAEQQHIIFDPIPRVAGIEPSSDPLLAVRAETYLISGRRRRSDR